MRAFQYKAGVLCQLVSQLVGRAILGGGFFRAQSVRVQIGVRLNSGEVVVRAARGHSC